jgi:hypothetical protein
LLIDQALRERGIARKQFADTRQIIINYRGKETLHDYWSPRGGAVDANALPGETAIATMASRYIHRSPSTKS